MPAAIVAIAGMAAGAGAAAAAVGAGLVVAAGIGASIISGVVGLAVSAVLSSATGLNKQKSESQSVDQLAKGVLLNTAGTVDPIMVVYGDRRLGGTRVLTEASGASNEYLHIVIAHCEGPVASIDTVYLDGTPTTDAKYAGLVTVETFLGADDQAACQSLIDALPGKWTAAHKLSGVAYTYVRLKYDSNVFNSLPTITADIHGRTVYDPRNGSTAWSTNPALCSRDYMTNARYGRGVPATEIDDVAFIVAANACESTFSAPDGTTHARHTCNGVVNTDQSSADNMVNILACCRGMLIFSAKGYGLLIDKAEVPSDFEFNEDNITGSWSFSTGGKRARFNRVRGNWYNPSNDWQADIYVSDSTAFRAEDNGLLLEAQVQIPFVTNPYEVQVLTERHMRQSRFGLTATFRAFIAGMFCEVGDVVPITHSTPGWVAKPFRITRISLLSSDEVEVEVAEYDDAVYSATPLTTPRLSMATNLPDPSNIPAPTELVLAMSTIDQPNGASVPRFTATWTAPLSMWVVGYDVAWREDDSPWDTAFVTEPKFTMLSTAVGRSYEVRVRSVGSLGNKSVWASTSGTQPVPATPPAAPLAHAVGGLFCVRLTWTFGDTRQDIRATEIWFCGENDRANAMRLSSEPFPGAEYTHPGMSPGAGGYYWLHVNDVWGNASEWYPSSAHSGLHATAISDPTDLLTQLEGAIGMPQIASDLAEPIGRIADIDLSGLNLAIDSLFQSVTSDILAGDTLKAVSAIKEEVINRDTAIKAETTARETLSAKIPGDIASAIKTERTVTATAISAEATARETLAAKIPGDIASAIQTERTVTATAISAEATARETLAAKMSDDIVSAILTERIVTSTALGAEATSRETLAAKVSNDIVAAVQEEQTARANAISAEATARTQLESKVGANTAAIASESSTRSSADSALSSRIDTVQASLGNSISTVQQKSEASASAITGLYAKWSVKTQVMQDGQYAVAGVELLSGVPGQSTFTVLADRFLVYQPNGQGAPKQVLTMGTVNGVTALGFDGSAIFDGSITARQINGTGLKITGEVNVGGYTGYFWPPAGQTGAHLSAQGFLAGNANGGGKYFQIHTPAGDWANARIDTNIPAYLGDLSVDTIHVKNNAITTTIHVQSADADAAALGWTGGWVTIASAYADVGASGAVSITCSALSTSTFVVEGNDYQYTVEYPNTIRILSPSSAVIAQQGVKGSFCLIGKGVQTGTYYLQVFFGGGSASVSGINMVLFVGKK